MPAEVFRTERFRSWKAAIEDTTAVVVDVPEEEQPKMVYILINGRPVQVSASFAREHFPKHVPRTPVKERQPVEPVLDVSGASRTAEVALLAIENRTREEGTQTSGDVEMVTVATETAEVGVSGASRPAGSDVSGASRTADVVSPTEDEPENLQQREQALRAAIADIDREHDALEQRLANMFIDAPVPDD